MKRLLMVMICVYLTACTGGERKVDTSKVSAEAPEPDIDIYVEGIIYSDNDPIAVINGDVYRIGDMVEGARVFEIGKDYVTLEYNNVMITRGIKGAPSAGQDPASAQPSSVKPSVSTSGPSTGGHLAKAQEYFRYARATRHLDQARQYYEKAMQEARWAIDYDKIANPLPAKEIIDASRAQLAELGCVSHESMALKHRSTANSLRWRGDYDKAREYYGNAIKSYNKFISCQSDQFERERVQAQIELIQSDIDRMDEWKQQENSL